MEISKELQDAMNDQLNFELYSAYIYQSMAAYFESINLSGMAHWMLKQAIEEYEHAMRFWKHIVDRAGRVILDEIKAPKTEWESPLAAWTDAYEHEKVVTKRIYDIGKLAEKEGDRGAEPLLHWFYDEQVEEEEQTLRVVDMLKMIGDAPSPLIMLDTQLGKRE